MVLKVKANWKTVKIPEVLFFQEGPGVRKNQFSTKGVKLLNVGNINEGKINLSKTKIYISEKEAFGKYKHFLIDDGDLVIASSGIVVENFYNKISFIEKTHLPLCMNTSTIRFKSLDKRILNLHYFKFFLKTNFFSNQLKKLITGSAQLNFGPSHLKKINLILPSLEEQNRIVKILDKADNLLQKRKQAILFLDDYLRSTFIEMFGDPVKNPKGWEISSMGNILKEIIAGWSAKGEDRIKLNDEYGVLKISAVTYGYFNPDEYKAVKISATNSKKLIYPKKGDLLFSRANTEELVGASCIVKENYSDLFLPDKLWKLVIDESKVDPIFLQKVMSNYKWRRELAKKATGTSGSMLNISMNKLRDEKLILPPLTLQNQFSELVSKTENIKQKMKTQCKELENQFQALMQKAFKGEL